MNRVTCQRRIRHWTIVAALTCAVFVLGAVGAGAQTTPEIRAWWADAWHQTTAGFNTAARCDTLIALTAAGGMNMVIPQVRRRGDTYYPSAIEPYASDASPSFDPIRYMLDRCHARTPRMEVYAWIVLIPAWSTQTLPTNPDYAVNKYPQYLTKNTAGSTWVDSVYQFDPGNPECEQYLNDVFMELVNNYPDLDGICYDYCRFSGTSCGYNDVNVARFNARYGLTGLPATTNSTWKQWRRDQITNLIRKNYATAFKVNPNIAIAAATVTWGNGPTTEGGWTSTSAYSSVLQDWRAWMEEGILDRNMPMCYYSETSYPTYYDNWIAYAKGHKYNRSVAPIVGTYLNTCTNAIKQLRECRTAGMNGIYGEGMGVYDYNVPTTDVGRAAFPATLTATSSYDTVTPPIFSTAVTVPAMPWKTAATKGHICGTVTNCDGTWADGATVTLTGTASRSMVTDGTGFYAFIDLTPGAYTVSVTWQSSTRSSSLTVVAGQMSEANFSWCSDTTAPVITNVRAENVNVASADIKWTTDDFATSQVDYGTTTSYGTTTTMDSSKVQSHTVSLSGLSPLQTYHYRVRSTNESGLTTVSGDYTFTTTQDTTAPVISNVQATSITNSTATITWDTDDPATTQVQYGLTTSYGSSTTEVATPVTGHSAAVSGLASGATYHYRVKSTNGASLTTYSSDYTFTTSTVVSDIVVDNSDSGWQILLGSWTLGSATSGRYGADYRFADVASTTTARCSWTPNILTGGKYQVSTWYTQGTNRSTIAPFTVVSANGSDTYTINQQSNGAQWYPITGSTSTNTFEFKAGTSGYVSLHNGTAESSKVVMADATLFHYVGPETTPPATPAAPTATAASLTQINLTWTATTDNFGVTGYKVYRNSVYVGSSATTSYSDTGLTANTQYSYTISAYDAASNASSQSSASACYTLPIQPTTSIITCNRTTGVWYDTTPFTFNNTGLGADKAAYYKYAWDHAATHSWTGSETTWSTTSVVCTASSSIQPWYFHVRSYNGGGVGGGTLDIGPYYCDTDNPTVSAVTAPKYKSRTGGYEDLQASWSGSDAISGVAEYEYAIGTTPGGADILDWTAAGTATSATYHLPSAPASGYTCYWSVVATDAAGNSCSPVTSGATVYADSYGTLAAAMDNADSTPVIISAAKTLSASFGTYFYVQEADRTRGLRIDGICSWTDGSLMKVAGMLTGSSAERALGSVEASLFGTGTGAPLPLGVSITAIGGRGPDSFTTGIGSVGAYNLGLLVRTVGKVASKGSGYFVLGDGSGATVKVYSSVVPADNAIVGATGVAGVESGVRVIRTRSAIDVQVY